MTDFNAESLASIGPKDFAQLIKSTPDSTLAEVMAGDTYGHAQLHAAQVRAWLDRICA